MTAGTTARVRSTLLLLALAVAGGLLPTAAGATYPGSNGRLVFVREGAVTSTNAAGGDAKRLAPVNSQYPSWSPNGRKVVYVKMAEGIGGFGELMVMNADGSGKKRIGRESRYTNPTFSPDGRKVMVTEYDGNARGETDLVVMNATDGSGRAEFAPRVTGSMSAGVWSPNGNRVAFIDGDGKLKTIGAGGRPGSVTRLGSFTGAEDPDWSPDSSRLVFARFNSGDGTTSIQRINAGGGGLRKLADGGDDPVWSPNGRRILFVAQDAEYNSHLWSMLADGSDKTLVARKGYAPAWQAR